MTKEIICTTDFEYNEAMALQAKNDALDPKHVSSDRIIVIDFRTMHN